MTKKKTPQERYQKEKMITFPLKLKKELIEEFKKNIDNDDNYKSATQFLKEQIERYNKEQTTKKNRD